ALLTLLPSAALASPIISSGSSSVAPLAVDVDAIPKGYVIECRSAEGTKLCKDSDEAKNFMQCRGSGEVFGVDGSRFEYCARDCVCVSTAGACGNRATC